MSFTIREQHLIECQVIQSTMNAGRATYWTMIASPRSIHWVVSHGANSWWSLREDARRREAESHWLKLTNGLAEPRPHTKKQPAFWRCGPVACRLRQLLGYENRPKRGPKGYTYHRERRLNGFSKEIIAGPSAPEAYDEYSGYEATKKRRGEMQ